MTGDGIQILSSSVLGRPSDFAIMWFVIGLIVGIVVGLIFGVFIGFSLFKRAGSWD